MDDLSTNTRRSDPLPRYLVYNNGYGFALTDRLIPGTGTNGKPAEYAHGKRGQLLGVYPTRSTAQAEADRLNQTFPV